MADENRMITYQHALLSLKDFKKSTPPNTLRCMTKSELNKYYLVEQEPLNSCANNQLVRRDRAIGKTINYYCPEINDIITDIAFLSDGSMVLVGNFSTYNGVVCPRGILKLSIGGNADQQFSNNNIGFSSGNINTVGIQSNDKIIVGGLFTTYNMNDVGKLVRINTDGSLDKTFNNNLVAVGDVKKVVVLPSDKILVGGNFNINGNKSLILLNSDGYIDYTFTPPFIQEVENINVLNNGKILVNGTMLLNPDGTVSSGFTATTGNLTVRCVAIQSDNKIILAGNDISGGNNHIRRLNTDGSVDTTFNGSVSVPGYNFIHTVFIDPDGKILVGGNIQTNPKHIRRLNTDGSVDSTFLGTTGFNNPVSIIKQTAIGKLTIGGSFTTYNGQPRVRLALLSYDGELMPCHS